MQWRDGAVMHSMVMLDGVDRASLRELEAAGEGLAGVRWIDSTTRFLRRVVGSTASAWALCW